MRRRCIDGGRRTIQQVGVGEADAGHIAAFDPHRGRLAHRRDDALGLRWAAAPADCGEVNLDIDWTESGGPPVVPPSHRGFGTRLIERGLSAELRSTVSLEFPASGVHCTIRAKLPAVAE